MSDERSIRIEASARLVDLWAGRLSDAERRDAELAIADDPALAAESALQKEIAATLRDEPPAAPEAAFGWRRLSKAIDAEASLARRDATAQRWRRVAIAASVLAAGQFAVFGALRLADNSAPAYVTASATADADRILKVSFVEGASLGDVEALLRDADGEIASGPSAIGLYDIAFTDEAAREAGLARFEAASGLVSTVAKP
ncbi:MAG: hypothetical protein ACFB00_02260 [Parvularculaceae bacterium]